MFRFFRSRLSYGPNPLKIAPSYPTGYLYPQIACVFNRKRSVFYEKSSRYHGF